MLRSEILFIVRIIGKLQNKKIKIPESRQNLKNVFHKKKIQKKNIWCHLVVSFFYKLSQPTQLFFLWISFRMSIMRFCIWVWNFPGRCGSHGRLKVLTHRAKLFVNWNDPRQTSLISALKEKKLLKKIVWSKSKFFFN